MCRMNEVKSIPEAMLAALHNAISLTDHLRNQLKRVLMARRLKIVKIFILRLKDGLVFPFGFFYMMGKCLLIKGCINSTLCPEVHQL